MTQLGRQGDQLPSGWPHLPVEDLPPKRATPVLTADEISKLQIADDQRAVFTEMVACLRIFRRGPLTEMAVPE